jgi:hypothetical protein
MRAVVVGWLVSGLVLAAGCARPRTCDPRAAPISTTTTPYVLFSDGHLGTIVTRRENVFGPDAGTYDVRDLDGLRGAVEVVLLKLPDLAREQGATYADLGGGALRIVGPPKAHGLVKEVLAMLRASPGPRSPGSI